MVLPLLVDESVDSHRLRRLLASAGRLVTLLLDVGLAGAHDSAIFAYAQQRGLTIITKNPGDFRRLHGPHHAGILIVCADNDPTRDMSDAEIVQAITNLLATGLPIAGEVHTLNHGRY